jgi:hypothetical protein
MDKAGALRKHSSAERGKSAKVIIYPAVADSVDLPDFSFFKSKGKDEFTLLTTGEQQSLFKNNATISNRLMFPLCRPFHLSALNSW